MLVEITALNTTPQGQKNYNQESSTGNKLPHVIHCWSPIVRCSQSI
jgi:hypothetical protein